MPDNTLKGKNILLVTSTNMASNPRCLKEVKALVNNGASVTVVKAQFNNWSNEYEKQIESSLPSVRWINVDVTRNALVSWVRSNLAQKEAKVLYSLFKKPRFLAYALDKRSYLLDGVLKKLDDKFHLVIAHNPGAFWSAYNFSVNRNVPLGIDIEDYHPGEYNSEDYKTRMLAIMDNTISGASYVSAAAPLILQHTLQNIKPAKSTSLVINNVFPKSLQPAFQLLPIANDTLKLFWFSQHVGMDRGLQDIIAAMNLVSDFTISLTLMGNYSVDVKAVLERALTNPKHKVIFKAPAPEVDLIREASNYHIGLALENGANFNRNICLTNKIFTYLLAGNCIVASDTDAQQLFMNEHPGVGLIYTSGQAKALADELLALYQNADELLAKRKAAYELAATKLNWETEQAAFIQLVDSICNAA